MPGCSKRRLEDMGREEALERMGQEMEEEETGESESRRAGAELE